MYIPSDEAEVRTTSRNRQRKNEIHNISEAQAAMMAMSLPLPTTVYHYYRGITALSTKIRVQKLFPLNANFNDVVTNEVLNSVIYFEKYAQNVCI